MSKEHFPVNDKSIADVNKANARAHSGDHVRESSQEKGEKQRDGWPRSLKESSMEHFLSLRSKGVNHASTKKHESELHGFGEEGKKIVSNHLTQHQANIKAGRYPDPDKK